MATRATFNLFGLPIAPGYNFNQPLTVFPYTPDPLQLTQGVPQVSHPYSTGIPQPGVPYYGDPQYGTAGQQLVKFLLSWGRPNSDWRTNPLPVFSNVTGSFKGFL